MEANNQQPVALTQTLSTSASQIGTQDCSVAELWTHIDGCLVRYLKCGSGPPLILVHGILGSAFCWRFNIPALASACTVYALDLPGVGYSGRLAERQCSLKTNAQRLLAFMTACGVERADLLGNSHGGAVAMMAAALAPERVHRLLLAAPVHPWMRERRLLIDFAASAAGGALMRLVAPRLGTLHGYFLRRMYGDARRIAPGTLQGYSGPIQVPGTVEHLLAIMRCWKHDLEELARILPLIRSIPTLLLWGTHDGAVSLGSAARLQQAFDDGQLEIFTGAGHLPYEEFPADFNQRVLHFLTHKKAAAV